MFVMKGFRRRARSSASNNASSGSLVLSTRETNISRPKKKSRNVSFGEVQIRTYPVTLDTTPLPPPPPPPLPMFVTEEDPEEVYYWFCSQRQEEEHQNISLTLDWEYHEFGSISVNAFETLREPDRKQGGEDALRISPERRYRIAKNAGFFCDEENDENDPSNDPCSQPPRTEESKDDSACLPEDEASPSISENHAFPTRNHIICRPGTKTRYFRNVGQESG